ncbi:MAG: DNA-binding protein [Methanomicrobiales archaeon HGW-Methanomicrobiales-4]|nr:MAG: DNA-binding protein [Methanomicrobiales archaeon HGW-Methanomicrobiales-4]
MQFASGSPGRIFYIRFDHDEDLLSGIQSFAAEHQIRSGIIHLIGAISEGSLVTGPKETILPPDQEWQNLSGAHELLGTGMIRSGPEGPKVHLHAAAGRGSSTLTGCFRKDTRIYIVIEAVIIEFSGFSVREFWDEKAALYLPKPEIPGQE